MLANYSPAQWFSAPGVVLVETRIGYLVSGIDAGILATLQIMLGKYG